MTGSPPITRQQGYRIQQSGHGRPKLVYWRSALNRLPAGGVKWDMRGVAAASWTMSEQDHDEDPDGPLVALARGRDLAAFETLYRRHRDRVYALVWRLCGGHHGLAEDLLQEAFVRVWQKLDSFRGDSRFATWLHRIAANVALTDRRSRLRRAQWEAPLEEPVERQAAGPRDVIAGTRNDLEQAIAALPQRARTVLVLHDVEGYRHAEIARMTGMAVGSSKAQLHRARKLVREALRK